MTTDHEQIADERTPRRSRDSLFHRLERVFAAEVLFFAAYLGSFVAIAAVLPLHRMAAFQWAALAAAIIGSVAGAGVTDRFRWPLGFFVAPRRAWISIVLGAVAALAIVGAADLGIAAMGGFARNIAEGSPSARELVLLFLPAVFHEELVFRGYPFQKLAAFNRPTAVLLSAAGFAALHLGNVAVGPVSLVNIFLAGVLLGLAWLLRRDLWFPLGIHFCWNVLSGPILGYPVSGYRPAATVFSTLPRGAEWISGGRFGIEGSVLVTVAELVAVVVFLLVLVKRERATATDADRF
ncbi:MAG: type II CAAX endopeptidase family protein [Thermoanaerobaculia bacterium]